MAIKNLLFDIGGVVLNLYPERTKIAFTDLGLKHEDTWFKGKEQSASLSAFERGQISIEEFIAENNRLANAQISIPDFTLAWNAMLGEVPIERIKFLESLKKSFKIYALSNINAIHELACDEIFSQHHYPTMASFFDDAFYSHYIRERKPDAAAFHHVIATVPLIPEETLFFDDLKDNIEMAARLGFKAYQVNHNTLETVLKALEENQFLS